MSQINNAHNENIEESINFYQQLLTLKREYKLLISTTFLVGTIGFFKAISIKPIWKGEFQIVISNDEKGGVDTNAFEILKGNSDYSDDLLTEINIISSPIVLMPVFNLYNEISEIKTKC